MRREAAVPALPPPQPSQLALGRDFPCLTGKRSFIGEEDCHSPRKAKNWLSVTGLSLEEAVLRGRQVPQQSADKMEDVVVEGSGSSDLALAADMDRVVPRTCCRCVHSPQGSRGCSGEFQPATSTPELCVERLQAKGHPVALGELSWPGHS